MATTPTRALDQIGLWCAIIGAFLFSWKPIFIKLNYALGVDAATQLVLRMAFSLPFYLAIGGYALWRRRRDGVPTDLSGNTLLWCAATGFIGFYGAAILDMTGIGYVTAQFGRLILFTYPTFVVLIGALFFGHTIRRNHLIALALSYLGLAIIFLVDLKSFGNQVTLGVALVLASSLVYAVYLLVSRSLIERQGSQLFTSLSMIAGSLGVAAHFAITNNVSDLAVPVSALWYSLGMALVSTVIPSILVSEAIGRIGAAPASLAGSAGPVFTTLAAITLLGEQFTLAHAAGMALVIAGIIVLSRGSSREFG